MISIYHSHPFLMAYLRPENAALTHESPARTTPVTHTHTHTLNIARCFFPLHPVVWMTTTSIQEEVMDEAEASSPWSMMKETV